jgi:precorrin-6A/cobalt-precorrin-6A reductase
MAQCSLKNGEFIYGDPPFSIKDEISLFESLNIDVLVIKNVGGKGSFAKVEAARALNILVLMIDKPQKSNTLVISSIPEIFKWVDTNL